MWALRPCWSGGAAIARHRSDADEVLDATLGRDTASTDDPKRVAATSSIHAMVGGGHVRRHPYVTAAVLLITALALVTVLGGFRRADPTYPEARVASTVDLGRFSITVTGARLLTTRPDGGELEPGERLLVVDATVLNTDAASGVFSDRLVEARFDGEQALDVANGPGDAGEYFQPLVTTPLLLAWDVAEDETVPDEVSLVFLRESYGWNNLVFNGPTWSGGVPFRSMALPVVR